MQIFQIVQIPAESTAEFFGMDPSSSTIFAAPAQPGKIGTAQQQFVFQLPEGVQFATATTNGTHQVRWKCKGNIAFIPLFNFQFIQSPIDPSTTEASAAVGGAIGSQPIPVQVLNLSDGTTAFIPMGGAAGASFQLAASQISGQVMMQNKLLA